MANEILPGELPPIARLRVNAGIAKNTSDIATNTTDIATNTSKLAGIEDLADVTDAANVAAAGAVMDSDISPAEGILRKTGAGAYTAIKSNLTATTDPGVSDDGVAGYAIGSKWINVTLDKVFEAIDVTTGAAVWKYLSAGITVGTAQATTSGTAWDFTGLPAAIKRITVMFNEFSLSGTNDTLVQLGDSGGFETTGYLATSSNFATTTNSTSGFIIRNTGAPRVFSGHLILTRISGNIWISTHFGKIVTNIVLGGGGSKTLTGDLTQIRITPTGSNTGDAGSVNIMYE